MEEGAVGPRGTVWVRQGPAEGEIETSIEPGASEAEAEAKEAVAWTSRSWRRVTGLDAAGDGGEAGTGDLEAETDHEQAGPGHRDEQPLMMLDALDLGRLPLPAEG